MKQYESFYKNGFELFEFDSACLNDILKDILNKKLKESFCLQQKYSNTLDLRPSAIDYSKEFLNVLKINQINSFIKSRTLKDLTLYHVQVRVANSTTSYMDWHRDTYYDNGNRVGMTPPGYKIIYYPRFKEDIKPRLNVAIGSHRLMLDKHQEDIKLVSSLPIESITTSNTSSLFFDVSLLHSVVPDEHNNSSIRLIYSFISKEQLLNSISEELHFKTSKMYEDLF